jgi:hypothetical protein
VANADISFLSHIGSKAPDSTTAKPLPNEVTDQVPQTKTLLFVKLPDRILIIDPSNQLVAEVVPADATTGSGADQRPGMPDSQGR